jgi:apolipoprotein D and lipocalin family protein
VVIIGLVSKILTMKSRKLCLVFISVLLTGCLGYPDTVTPVRGYDINQYLGTWYEIARLDHSFEDGLDNVTAEYSLREDGGVNVLNKGFSSKDKQWTEADGKAYLVNGSDEGYLKVSFFGPFYGSYVIFELDTDDYQYAFVSGPNTSYLWFLSRTPEVDQALLDRFVERADSLGFDTSKLIFPSQKPRPESS